ncbi:MAG: RHS repeat-associated core domain-containing protein [Chloroflexota bacterium]
MRQGGELFYLLSDHLGSTSATVRPGGGDLRETWYGPWGNTRLSLGSPPTDNLFTGQKLDASTDLYYYGARYYDPSLGRFLSPDKVDPDSKSPQTLNRYSYVSNNPLKYVDPSGKWLVPAAAFVIGAAVSYGAQVYNNVQQGMDLGAAATTNIDVGAVVAGGAVATTAVMLAPVALAGAGEALAGAGLAYWLNDPLRCRNVREWGGRGASGSCLWRGRRCRN